MTQKVTVSRARLEQLLEALKIWCRGFPDLVSDEDRKSIAAIEEALAEPEQEPVAVKHMMEWIDYLKRKSDYGQHLQIPAELSAGACWDLARELEQFINITPPQEQRSFDMRKPLTDKQILEILCIRLMEDDDIEDWRDEINVARAIEAAHNIKE